MSTCPKCGAQLNDQVQVCPYCSPPDHRPEPLAAPPVLKPSSQPPPLPPVPPRRSAPTYFPAPPPRPTEQTSWVGAAGAVFTIIFLLTVAIVGAVLFFRDASPKFARPTPPPPPSPVQVQPRPAPARPRPAPPVGFSPAATNPAAKPWPANQWATMNDKQKAAALATLLGRLTSNSFAERRSGAEALGALQADAREAIPQLEALTGDPHACVRHAAAFALGAIGSDSPASIEVLVKLLEDTDTHVRPFAATALQKVQPTNAAYLAYRRQSASPQSLVSPASAGSYNDLAWKLVQEKKNPQIALNYARKAAELSPNDCNIKDTLGWAYLRNDRHPEALRVFGDVVTSFPYEQRGVASSWRGAMEAVQAPVAPADWQRFVERIAADANYRTRIRLSALQAEFQRRQGDSSQARDYWRQTGFLPEINWFTLGPFADPEGRLARNDAPPDNAARPDLEKRHQGLRGAIRWERRGDGLPDGYVDFESILGVPGFWQGAYAWTEFEVSAAREARLRVGADGVVALWLNGALVRPTIQPRNGDLDQDQVTVRLKTGTNTLLVRCCSRTTDWGFYLRLTGDDLEPLPELRSEP